MALPLPTPQTPFQRAEQMENFVQMMKHRELANHLQKMQQQYAPQKMQLQNQLLQGQVQQLPFRNALMKAQAERMQAQSSDPFAGVTTGAAGQQRALNAVATRYGQESPQYQQLKSMLDADRNEKEARAKYFGANVQYKNLPTVTKLGMISQQGVGSQPQLNQSPIQESAKDALIKQTVPAQIQNQRYYAATAGTIYNQANQFMPEVAKYAGAKGSFNNLIDKIGSSAGEDDPTYSALLQYKQLMPLLGNEVRRQIGGQASDAETKILNEVTSPSLWNKSPAYILRMWQNLGNLMNNTSRVLKKSQSEVESNLGKEANVQNYGKTQSAKKSDYRFNPQTGRIEPV